MGIRKKTGFFFLFLLAWSGFILPACENKNPPVVPGTPLVNTPVPCAGVLGNNAAVTTNPGPPDLVFVLAVPVTNTTLLSLSVYTTGSSPVTYEAGIYSDNAGVPLNLLEETGPQTLSAPATQWNSASLIHPLNLSGGVTYWLAFQATGYKYGASGTGAAFGYQPISSFGTLPGAFSGTVQSSPIFAFSIYGTICP